MNDRIKSEHASFSVTAKTTMDDMMMEARLAEMSRSGVRETFVALQDEIMQLRKVLAEKDRKIVELNNVYLKTIREHNSIISSMRKEAEELDKRYSAPFRLWEQMRVIAEAESKSENKEGVNG